MRIEIAGRRAREALTAGGRVCAVFRRSFYVRSQDGAFACIGEASLGRGPLNALACEFTVPAVGEPVSASFEDCAIWRSPAAKPSLDLAQLKKCRPPEDGLGCCIVGRRNALARHALPALEAVDRWLAGAPLSQEIEALIGLGPGLTPSGDDYLGGVMVALHKLRRSEQATLLWRSLEPRLAARTSEISAAHLRAAAEGEAHEALHSVLCGDPDFARLDTVGHCSAWDALAGAVSVLRAR
ncbi:MAG TPA: DUF2877 domain-containing protein [Burkholderiales bacterium]|nr:DUF2877 domain-containing protein [Burkholderiales bacterium]